MAIQEFSSGPQNYFEPGYFLGDYTEPNVSRAGLACQASCIKGFSISSQNYFETGYFVENYIESNVIKAGFACETDYIVGFQVTFGLYFVEGYLNEIYFFDNTSEFTVSAQCSATKSFAVSATGYYEPDYFVDDYFQSRGAAADLVCAATRIISSSVNLASVWSQSVTADGIIKQSSVSLSTAVAQTTVASKTVDASAAFVAAFAPTLTASALKNQTAIVASVITMSTAASVTRSTNVLLEHIADLNAMAAMSVGLSASLSISATQTTSAVSIPGILITASSTATLSCAVENLVFASAEFTVSAKILAVTSRNQYGRPITIDDPLQSVEFVTNPVKYGTHAARTGAAFIKTIANPNIRFVNQNVLEGWINPADVIQDGQTLMAIGATGGSSTNAAGDNQWILQYRSVTGGFALRLLVKNSSGTTQIFQTTPTGSADILNQYRPAVGSYTHYAVTRDGSGVMQVFRNGTQLISGTVSTMGTASEYRAWFGNNNSQGRWDELSLRKKTSGITQAQQTDQPETQVFLFHFDNNLNDDTSNTINVTHSMAAALASTVTLSAQANANTKLVSADLSASTAVSATVIKIQSVTADLATNFTVTVLAGKLIDQTISINSALAFALSNTVFEGTAVAVSINSTLAANIDRIRGFASVQSANFTQSASAQRLRSTPVAFTAFNAITLTAVVIEATWDARTWIIGDKFPSDYRLEPRGIAVDDDNERVFEIYAYAQGGLTPDTGFYITERNDRDGSSQWQQSYKFSNGKFSVSNLDGVQRISEPAYYDGHLYFAVRIVPSSGGETFRTKIYKYNVENQTFVWTMTPHMQTVNVIKVYNGELYAVGGSTIGDQVFAVIKFNTAGTIVWNKFINNAALASDIDFYGDHLYVTPDADGSVSVVKLATSNGALITSVNIDDSSTQPTNGEIAINSQGDIFVYSGGGFLFKLNTNLELVIAKKIQRVLDQTTISNSVTDIGFAADGDLILGMGQGLMKVANDLVTIKWIKRFVYGAPDQGSPTTRHIAIDTGNRFYWQASQVSLDQNDLSLLGRALQLDGGLSFSNFAFRDGLERSGSPAEWTWNTWVGGAPFITNVTTAFAGTQNPAPTFSSYTLNTTAPTIIEDDETLVDYLYFYVVSGIGILSSQFTGNFIGGMFKGTDVALNTAVNITATGTALRLANSDQNSAVTVNAVARKITDINSAVNVQATVTVTALVVRLVAASASSVASAEINAVKTTGIVSNVVVNTAISATGRGIFEGQPQLAAIASNLTVAAKNATGTVLLESVTAMQVTAEKNAVGVIQLVSEFTQSTETADAKTVRAAAAISAQFTQVIDGLRIQPAGANLSAQFTQTTNTADSKVVRITASANSTASVTITAARTRSTSSTQSATTVMVCNNVVLRQASANLSVVVYDFTASPTFIVRITATFSAFNSQLTVGTVINLDPALTLRVLPESRRIKITQETRVLSIESETRVNIIKD